MERSLHKAQTTFLSLPLYYNITASHTNIFITKIPPRKVPAYMMRAGEPEAFESVAEAVLFRNVPLLPVLHTRNKIDIF